MSKLPVSSKIILNLPFTCYCSSTSTSIVSPLHTEPNRKYIPRYEEDKLLAQDHIASILEKKGEHRQVGDLHIHYADHDNSVLLLRYA